MAGDPNVLNPVVAQGVILPRGNGVVIGNGRTNFNDLPLLPAGPAGPPGPQGPIGPQGQIGPKGDAGDPSGGGGDTLPSQVGHNGEFLQTDGANPLWVPLPGGGDALTSDTLDQFANVTQVPGKSLVITETTTLGGGTNTGDQTITLTGDVGGTGTGSFAATIAASAVTLAKMADVATATVFYRKTASTGVPEVQGIGTLKADLGLSGTNTGDQTITLTGDVTGTGTGSFAATIGNDKVTYAKMQNVSATDKLIGRSTAGAGDPEEITCTAAGRALIDDADAAAQRVTLGVVSDAAYNATTWDGVTDVAPSKNAVRDEIEALSLGAGSTIPATTNLIAGDGAGDGADSGIDPADVLTTANVAALPNSTFRLSVLNFTDVNLSTVLSGSTYTLVPGVNYYGDVSVSGGKTFAFSPALVATDPPINIRIHVTATGTLTVPTLIRDTDSGSITTVAATAVGYYTISFFKSNDGNLHLIDDLPQPITSSDVDTSVISDTAYDATTWNGDVDTAPSKNAVRDKIESLIDPTTLISNTAYDATTWDGVTTIAPSKNAVRDYFEALSALAQTLTNKRITKRTGSTTSTATPSINSDSFDVYEITALATAITSLTITGTPTDNQPLALRIKDDGTARALAFGTGSCAFSTDLAAPTTTTSGKYLYCTFLYNSTLTKWVMTGKLDNV